MSWSIPDTYDQSCCSKTAIWSSDFHSKSLIYFSPGGKTLVQLKACYASILAANGRLTLLAFILIMILVCDHGILVLLQVPRILSLLLTVAILWRAREYAWLKRWQRLSWILWPNRILWMWSVEEQVIGMRLESEYLSCSQHTDCGWNPSFYVVLIYTILWNRVSLILSRLGSVVKKDAAHSGMLMQCKTLTLVLSSKTVRSPKMIYHIMAISSQCWKNVIRGLSFISVWEGIGKVQHWGGHVFLEATV